MSTGLLGFITAPLNSGLESLLGVENAHRLRTYVGNNISLESLARLYQNKEAIAWIITLVKDVFWMAIGAFKWICYWLWKPVDWVARKIKEGIDWLVKKIIDMIIGERVHAQ